MSLSATKKRIVFVGGGAVALLIICAGLVFVFGDQYSWRDGKYALLSVDTRGQMCLIIDQGDGGPGIVGPTVFSVGSNDRFIVIKQHPGKDAFGDFDRNVTRYFIVEKAAAPTDGSPAKSIRGPLDEAAFEAARKELPLPEFTTTFDDLK